MGVSDVATRIAEPADFAPAVPGRVDDGNGPVVPDLCHVSMVFVHPEHWGHGVGQLLLDHVADVARNQGYTRLQLWTGESNHRAQRLYLRAGFTPTGRTTYLASGEPILHLRRYVTAT